MRFHYLKKDEINMKRCVKCILSETFPGIRFNEDGVCNFCIAFKGIEHLEKKKAEYKQKFAGIIVDTRQGW